MSDELKEEDFQEISFEEKDKTNPEKEIDIDVDFLQDKQRFQINEDLQNIAISSHRTPPTNKTKYDYLSDLESQSDQKEKKGNRNGCCFLV